MFCVPCWGRAVALCVTARLSAMPRHSVSSHCGEYHVAGSFPGALLVEYVFQSSSRFPPLAYGKMKWNRCRCLKAVRTGTIRSCRGTCWFARSSSLKLSPEIRDFLKVFKANSFSSPCYCCQSALNWEKLMAVVNWLTRL